VYGFSGDIDIIANLQKTFSTIKQSIKTQHPQMITGTGVQYNDGDKMPASHLVGMNFLDSDAVDHFCINLTKMRVFEKSHINRTRNQELFHAPYCLLLTGLDMNNYTMRSVFSDFDFVFQKAIYAIKGSREQRSFLLNLVGLFNSTFYSYLNLMMGSSLGVEREQRLITEVFEFPCIQNNEITQQVDLIQEMSKREDFIFVQDVSGEIEKLNDMIFEAFGIADNPFIDYALNIQIPQLKNANNSKAFQSVNADQLKIYTNPFLNAFSEIFSMSGRYVTANIYPDVTKHYSAVEIILHESKPSEFIKIVDEPTSTQTIMTRFSAHKVNDVFFKVKDVIHFKEDSFYIIKPNYYKNWHPAIAEIDLAEVIDQILSRNGRNG
jgi:hypothetical protein